jgi:hypothetical protein
MRLPLGHGPLIEHGPAAAEGQVAHLAREAEEAPAAELRRVGRRVQQVLEQLFEKMDAMRLSQ